MTTPNLYQRIAQFYDDSSSLWEEIWGEHMHQGYYGRGGKYKLNRRQAQIDLIVELLRWGNITQVENVLDVGCGIGGSTLYLAEKFNCRGVGITLSAKQAARAKGRALEKGLDERVSFQVADALEMPFADNQFDLVWSLESGEHMSDKEQFLKECFRVLKPQGTLILATWCHRPTDSLAGKLTPSEKRHLEAIYRVYCLPFVISLPEYEIIAKNCGFNAIYSDDWSLSVAPFWDVVIDSALNPQAIIGLLSSSWGTIEGALSLGLMSQGYDKGLVRFGVLCARKIDDSVDTNTINR
jgi:tocopherol O-methyltransferase